MNSPLEGTGDAGKGCYTPTGERISKEKAGRLGRSACGQRRGRGSASRAEHQPTQPAARADRSDAVVWRIPSEGRPPVQGDGLDFRTQAQPRASAGGNAGV